MDNSLLAVRDITHKYIVVERSWYNGNEKPMWKDSRRTAPQGKS